MSAKLTVQNAAGTRDFLPDEIALRDRVLRIIEASFAVYGFQPLETPSIERLDVLSGKYGKEADRLIFKILKRGESLKAGMETGDLCDLGLRYDLTVPLARVVAMNRGQLMFPFKRYQIQPVWRAERPQKGRYREFIQCDADVVGTASVSADAEIIALTDDILQRLGIPGYRIHINHRMLLQAIIKRAGIPDERFFEACIIIDKLDKIGWDGVLGALRENDFSEDSISKLSSLLQSSGTPAEILKTIDPEIVDFGALGVPDERLSFDLYLARGLDYYTGPIYETLVEEPKIGSITGGGRYDGLIGVFSGETIPATGTTIGIERIIDVIKELNLFKEDTGGKISVLVAVFSQETWRESLKIASEIRNESIAAEIYLEAGKKLGKQFSYADKKGIPLVVIAGPDEITRGEVTVKDLSSGEQRSISRGLLVQEIKKLKRV
jgi:histidyl-tRNA synthetase